MNINDEMRITPVEFTQTMEFLIKAYNQHFDSNEEVSGEVYISSKENLS